MASDPTTAGFILDPQTLAAKILHWKQQGYHVLSPAIQMSMFAPGYGVNASLVLLDGTVDNDGAGVDVYFDKNTMDGALDRQVQDSDQRAPSKIGLMKIAAATGVSWVKPYGRQDPLTIQNLWIYQVTGVYLAYDGTPQTIKGEKEIDYRDGSAQIGEWSREAWAALEQRNKHLAQGQRAEYSLNGWSDKRVRQARTNGAERAETGALERAIRTLGVRHVYTIGELKKPFVALRVCPVMDTADPAVRAMLAERQVAGVAALYAGATTRPAMPEAYQPATIDVSPRREPEPVAVVPIAAPPPQVSQPVPPQIPAAREPGQDDDIDDREFAEAELQRAGHAITIVDVKTRKKAFGPKHAKAGQEFQLWDVTGSDGVLYTTSFAKWGNKATKCWHDKALVVIEAPANRFNENEILNIQLASDVLTNELPAAPAEMKL